MLVSAALSTNMSLTGPATMCFQSIDRALHSILFSAIRTPPFRITRKFGKEIWKYKNYLPKIWRKSHILEVIVAVDDECVVLNEWLSADDSQVREDPRKTSQPSGKQWNCEGMNNYAFENDYWTKLNGIEPWMNKISAFNWPNYFFRFWFSLLLYFLLLWTRNYDIACPKIF